MKQQYEHSSSVVRGTKNVMSQVAPLNQCYIDDFLDQTVIEHCKTFDSGIILNTT